MVPYLGRSHVKISETLCEITFQVKIVSEIEQSRLIIIRKTVVIGN